VSRKERMNEDGIGVGIGVANATAIVTATAMITTTTVWRGEVELEWTIGGF